MEILKNFISPYLELKTSQNFQEFKVFPVTLLFFYVRNKQIFSMQYIMMFKYLFNFEMNEYKKNEIFKHDTS